MNLTILAKKIRVCIANAKKKKPKKKQKKGEGENERIIPIKRKIKNKINGPSNRAFFNARFVSIGLTHISLRRDKEIFITLNIIFSHTF